MIVEAVPIGIWDSFLCLSGSVTGYHGTVTRGAGENCLKNAACPASQAVGRVPVGVRNCQKPSGYLNPLEIRQWLRLKQVEQGRYEYVG